MRPLIFGNSSLGIPINAFQFGTQGPKVLLMGGVHGDEPEGVTLAQGLLAHFIRHFDYRLQITLIPMFNPDGVIMHTRTNGRGVDLNRNMPTKDWNPEARAPRYSPGPFAGSEPESKALGTWIEIERPALVMSFHSWEPMLNTNGDCKGEAEVLAKWTGYKITDDIGYPTPGSHGTYLGHERGIPTLTYEIQRDLPLDQVLEKHLKPVLEALKYTEEHRR